MDPRGIVAASTAASFGAPLAAAGIAGANKLVPATFLVIVGTVTLYGLTASPVARLLGLNKTADAELPDAEPLDAEPLGAKLRDAGPPDLPVEAETVRSSEDDHGEER